MDCKRRGRAGFLKGKLMWSLYRATATHKLPPSSTTVLHLPYAAKGKPNPTADHGGYMKMLSQQEKHSRSSRPDQSNNNIPAHQLTLLPTHTRSVSYYPPTTKIPNNTAVDSYSATNMDAPYGGIAVDEEIDRKAANYISSVRERFRIDYLN